MGVAENGSVWSGFIFNVIYVQKRSKLEFGEKNVLRYIDSYASTPTISNFKGFFLRGVLIGTQQACFALDQHSRSFPEKLA